MLDVGWTELMLIGIVALLVIGPKDLPEMFRQLGRFTAKMRSMAREFQRAMDEAARQSGVSDVAKDLRSATSPKAMGLDAMKSAADKFEKWDPIKNAAKPTVAPVAKPLGGNTILADAPVNADPGTAAAAAPAKPPVMGPATAAMYEKQAAKAAAYREYSAKLKAIEDGTGIAPVAEVVAKAPAKPRVAKHKAAAVAPVAQEVAAPAAKAPRAPASKKAPKA